MSDDAETILTLEVKRDGDQALVYCRGKLVYGVSDLVQSKVGLLIPESKRIVMDLTEVTHMDSVGLGALVRLYVSGKSKGCEIKLINFRKQIRHLLSLSNLLTVFATPEGLDIPIH